MRLDTYMDKKRSEFHFLPPIYAFVTLITPYNVKPSRLPILEPLNIYF